MKLEFSLQIFEEKSNIKFYQNLSSGSRVVSGGQTYRRIDGGQTDMTKLILAFRNFANAPKTSPRATRSWEIF
jgi:hypothetical protein